MRRAWLLAAALVAACQQGDAPADEASATPAVVEAVPPPSLEPLADGDGAVVGENMSNIGGCSFHDRDGTLLLSVGIPDNYDLPEGAGGPAIGVARPNGERTMFTADKADAGFVEGGPTLSGGGFKLAVVRAEGEGKALDRELVEYSAHLEITAPDGTTRIYSPGGWRCGV